jgi:uncharacterized RDD family membrane protein YckC
MNARFRCRRRPCRTLLMFNYVSPFWIKATLYRVFSVFSNSRIWQIRVIFPSGRPATNPQCLFRRFRRRAGLLKP